MSEEELIETLKEFEKNRVEKLKEPSKNLFYAIMKIADERDKYKKLLDKIKEKCLSIKGNPEHTIVSKNELVKQFLELLEEIK